MLQPYLAGKVPRPGTCQAGYRCALGRMSAWTDSRARAAWERAIGEVHGQVQIVWLWAWHGAGDLLGGLPALAWGSGVIGVQLAVSLYGTKVAPGPGCSR